MQNSCLKTSAWWSRNSHFVENGYLSLRFPNMVKVNIHEHWTRVTRFNPLWVSGSIQFHFYAESMKSKRCFAAFPVACVAGSTGVGVWEKREEDWGDTLSHFSPSLLPPFFWPAIQVTSLKFPTSNFYFPVSTSQLVMTQDDEPDSSLKHHVLCCFFEIVMPNRGICLRLAL